VLIYLFKKKNPHLDPLPNHVMSFRHRSDGSFIIKKLSGEQVKYVAQDASDPMKHLA